LEIRRIRVARELLLCTAMKLLAGVALAALAMTAGACTDTTTVWGDWRADQHAAGSCQAFLFGADAHVQISDGRSLSVSEDVDCDDLGFSAEIPIDVTHVRVTATDASCGFWENSFDLDPDLGYIYVGVILFDHGTSGD
jgi:hypothetical protein